MEDIDKSNILVSVLHIKEAALLLDNKENDISLALLQLSRYLIEQNGLLSGDIENAKEIIETITDNEQEATLHRTNNL